MAARSPDSELVHATCVALDGAGVLLRGPPGAGKSDLALRLIAAGAALVADDQCLLTRESGRVWARPPAALAGRIEVRGVGILSLDHLEAAPLALAVDLLPADAVPRLPEAAAVELVGVRLPALGLAPLEASAVAKVTLALRAVTGRGAAFVAPEPGS